MSGGEGRAAGPMSAGNSLGVLGAEERRACPRGSRRSASAAASAAAVGRERRGAQPEQVCDATPGTPSGSLPSRGGAAGGAAPPAGRGAGGGGRACACLPSLPARGRG